MNYPEKENPGPDSLYTPIPDSEKRKPRAWLVVSLIIIAIGGCVLYYFFDPVEYGWMPQCIFHRLTGLQCMGCGSQRMFHALLHGDVGGAFQANFFGMLMLPVIAFMLFVETQRLRRPSLYAAVFSPKVIGLLIVLMIAWLILRNLLGV